MNIINHNDNDPLTARILNLLKEQTELVKRILAVVDMDEDIVISVVARFSLIESRCLMLINCLHESSEHSKVDQLNFDHEMLFLDASEVFLGDIKMILKEVE